MAFISDNTTEEFLATVGNSSFNRHLTFTNETNTNATIIHDTYPSGYSLPHIVFASIVVTLLMIVIIVGNMLVIIAIITEKSLKNIQNWFIASLAVADFFLGLVIMPFSLANELMGYWIFGPWWCDIHSGRCMVKLVAVAVGHFGLCRRTSNMTHTHRHPTIYIISIQICSINPKYGTLRVSHPDSRPCNSREKEKRSFLFKLLLHLNLII